MGELHPLVVQLFAIAANIATIFAVGVAIYYGRKAYNSWKNQLRGTQQHDLALRLLTVLPAINNQLIFFRTSAKPNPEDFQLMQEAHEMYKHELKLGPFDPTDKRPAPKDEIEDLHKSWTRVDDVMVKFSAEALEAKIILDDKTNEVIKRITDFVDTCMNDYVAYSYTLGQMPDPSLREPNPEEEKNMWEKYNKVFPPWENYKLAIPEFDELIKELETHLEKYLLK